jgi:hypothetical protein
VVGGYLPGFYVVATGLLEASRGSLIVLCLRWHLSVPLRTFHAPGVMGVAVR